VKQAGIHSHVLTRLVREGALERASRGRYLLPDHPLTENHGLVLVAARVPAGVVCLVSALAFHEIGTQLPYQVWIAVPRGARRPAIEYPPIRLVRFSGGAYTEGVETHRIEGQQVRVYSVAKTLADVFKYRNRVGLDVALEALREAWRERKFTMDEVDHYARVCRVQRVMQPYLEALVA
jgi:predicted transcriptional regulator of viral defense system